MSTTTHRRWGVAVLAFVALAALPLVLSADHAWGPYHWARTQNPLPLKIGDNVSTIWDARLDEAIADWNQSSVLALTEVGPNATGNCRPPNGQVSVCNKTYGNNGWLGLAQIWVTGGEHITKASAKMNDTYFNQAQYNTVPWRRLVMCQEIAHDFGLDHQDENFNNPNLGTCMDYTSDPDGPPSNEHPNNHDYEQLEDIYAHLDDFNSWTLTGGGSDSAVGGMPPAMSQIDFDGPGQWGQLVYLSPHGTFSIFELDFGGGNKVLTHVTWTIERARELARMREELSR